MDHREKKERRTFALCDTNRYAMMTRNSCLTAAAIAAVSIFAGCDAPVSPAPMTEKPSPAREIKGAPKERQAAFLNRIREADPTHQAIDRAFLNERNELGLILGHTVEMDKIPDLMRSLLTQMAREFPGQDLTILAYTPSNPPRKIGTAHLNAQTHDMSYTPAQ